MRGSFRVARIAGIDIGIHYTWLFIFGLIMWFLAANYFPQYSPGYPVVVYWGMGAAAALLLFVSVLLHELAHSLYARAHGVAVSSIVLFLFGGVSNLHEDSHRPREEFWMAFLGPLTSLVLAVVFAVVVVLAGGDQALSGDILTPGTSILWYLMTVNAALFVFNLLPGFPLDGGRVFRSIVWGATGDRDKATRWAARVGQVIAWAMILGGVTIIFGALFYNFQVSPVQGIWLILIGWFLNNAAEASRREVTLARYLTGVPVDAVMDTSPLAVSQNTSVDTLVREVFVQQGRPAAAVTDGDSVSGIVTLTDIKGLAREVWYDTPVAKIMTRAPLYSVGPKDDLMAAMKLIGDNHLNQLLVLENGRLVGMLRRADILRYLHLSQELHLPRRPSAADGS